MSWFGWLLAALFAAAFAIVAWPLAQRLDAAAGRLEAVAGGFSRDRATFAADASAVLREVAFQVETEETGEAPAPLAEPEPSAAIVLAAPSVIDADTYDAEGRRYRLSGYDAPGVRGDARCAAELALGEHARAFVQALFNQRRVLAYPVTVQPANERFRRERTVAVVTVDGEDLGARLAREGFARRTTGRFGWCQGR